MISSNGFHEISQYTNEFLNQHTREYVTNYTTL